MATPLALAVSADSPRAAIIASYAGRSAGSIRRGYARQAIRDDRFQP
jgi:hypothetical protein